MHIKARVMVRVAHVSVVEEPNVSHVEHLVAFFFKKWLEVFRWFDQVAEPDHRWQIMLSTLEESSSKLDRASVIFVLSLYCTGKLS